MLSVLSRTPEKKRKEKKRKEKKRKEKKRKEKKRVNSGSVFLLGKVKCLCRSSPLG